jgi:high-affinity Fe2+/Pb2+ permease
MFGPILLFFFFFFGIHNFENNNNNNKNRQNNRTSKPALSISGKFLVYLVSLWATEKNSGLFGSPKRRGI